MKESRDPPHQQRRCVVCRRGAPQGELLRFVFRGRELIWDHAEKRLPGRGAYLHRSASCVSNMGEAGRWEHALRLPKGSLDMSVLRGVMSAVMEAEVLQGGMIETGTLPKHPGGKGKRSTVKKVRL